MTQLSITTTQNVNINFTAASVAERIFGFLIDMVIKIAYVIVLFYVVFYYLGVNEWIAGWDDWSKGALYMVFMLPIMFYSLIQESIFEGQTFGKRLLKTKVVKIDGYQASFGDYLIRWLFRLIEMDSFWMVGIVTIAINKNVQRLGDIAAGTAVISLKSKVTIDSTILQEIDDNYVPIYPTVIRLSDNDVRIIKENFELAYMKKDYAVINKLKLKIEEVTGIKNQSGNDMDFLRTILKDYNYYTRNM